MAESPTQRTLAYFRSFGWTVAITEKWNPHARIRQDLFGCIDLVAVKDGCGILGLQACAGGSHAARRAKALDEPRLAEWLKAGGRFEIVSWSKRGGVGKRKIFTMRREEIRLEDINNHACAKYPSEQSSERDSGASL